MIKVFHFVKENEIRKYNIQNRAFELEINPKVFPPSLHGSFFAENMKISEGETVLDVGTGSGFLAIIAVKLGGMVSATDTDKDALELAAKNALRNNVNINFLQGEYFADFKQKFDVIVVNLPQEIVPENYRTAIGEQLTRSFWGGIDGNKPVLEFLDVARNYMHKDSRIYLIVYTVTDYRRTIKKVIDLYNAKLIAFDSGPTKEFVEDNIDYYLKKMK